MNAEHDRHLSIAGLSKTFTLHVLRGKRVPAFDDVSFAVPRGKITAIIGPSGSGKSSLLKCIYRTYLPTRGRILYHGAGGDVDLAAADDHAILALRRREIGYVAQFLKAPPRLTAAAVVARPLVEQGVARGAAMAAAAALLARLNLPAELHDAYPALFSGGEQQRVNIARALIGRADLLLLDEPTSALDHANLRSVAAMLREARAAGTTIVGIFHDAAMVAALADQIVVMEQGTVPYAGPWSGVPETYRTAAVDAA